MYSRLSCTEFKTLMDEGAQLIDVRSSREFNMGALPQAANIPLEQFMGAPNLLDRSKPVLVYCKSGRRSSMAQRYLKDCGFSQVLNLGAYQDYQPCSATS